MIFAGWSTDWSLIRIEKEKVWVLRLPVLQCILDCMFKQLNLYVLAITIYRFQCDIQYKAVFPSAQAPCSASAHMGSGECSLSHTAIWHSSPHPLCSTPPSVLLISRLSVRLHKFTQQLFVRAFTSPLWCFFVCSVSTQVHLRIF